MSRKKKASQEICKSKVMCKYFVFLSFFFCFFYAEVVSGTGAVPEDSANLFRSMPNFLAVACNPSF